MAPLSRADLTAPEGAAATNRRAPATPATSTPTQAPSGARTHHPAATRDAADRRAHPEAAIAAHRPEGHARSTDHSTDRPSQERADTYQAVRDTGGTRRAPQQPNQPTAGPAPPSARPHASTRRRHRYDGPELLFVAATAQRGGPSGAYAALPFRISMPPSCHGSKGNRLPLPKPAATSDENAK